MITQEIVHTCSNPHVAAAALASIGGEFAERFANKARRCDIATGALVARMVREFSRAAAEEDWVEVDEAARGADQPILSGLRYILTHALKTHAPDFLSGQAPCAGRWDQHVHHCCA